LEPQPGPKSEAQTLSEPVTFEARFRPESQTYRVGQEMRNCGVFKRSVRVAEGTRFYHTEK